MTNGQIRFLKSLGKACVVLFAISLVVAFGIAVWTYYRLKVVLPRITQPAIAADRARLAARPARPVIEGEATDDNAADPYGSALRSVQNAMKTAGTGAAYSMMHLVALDGPWPPTRPSTPGTETLAAARTLLDQHRAEVDAARVGVRARREWARWQPELRVIDPQAIEALANLLILAGHEKARANEFHDAAVRYLEAVRLSWDLAEEPGHDNGSATFLGGGGLQALGILVTSGLLPDAELGWIKSSLDRLQPTMPSLAESVRHQWVGWALSCSPENIPAFHAMMAGMGEPVWWPRLWLACARAVDDDLPPLFEEASRAASIEDPQNAEARLRALDQSDAIRALPMVEIIGRLTDGIAGFLGDALVHNLTMRARFALVHTAIQIEEKRRKDGRYPADLTALMAADPFAKPGVGLRFAVDADGRGYKLWSVGEDHKDDGGKNSDLVLRRGRARET